jgi:hypothetical protein
MPSPKRKSPTVKQLKSHLKSMGVGYGGAKTKRQLMAHARKVRVNSGRAGAMRMYAGLAGVKRSAKKSQLQQLARSKGISPQGTRGQLLMKLHKRAAQQRRSAQKQKAWARLGADV